jgi:hypothetical protein
MTSRSAENNNCSENIRPVQAVEYADIKISVDIMYYYTDNI